MFRLITWRTLLPPPRAHKVTVQNFDPSVDWHNYSFFPVPQFDIIPRWTDKFSTEFDCDRALLPRPVSARDNNCGRLRPKYVERSAASQTAGFSIRFFSFCAACDADFWDVLLYFRCLLILRFGTLRLWQAGRPLPCDVWHCVICLIYRTNVNSKDVYIICNLSRMINATKLCLETCYVDITT